jgi:hypothetical protein
MSWLELMKCRERRGGSCGLSGRINSSSHTRGPDVLSLKLVILIASYFFILLVVLISPEAAGLVI